MEQEASMPKIVYSCYYTSSRGGEQFVQKHVFSYQISGTMIMNDGTDEHQFVEGDYRFIKRNLLSKFTKLPPANGDFKSISILLDQDTLQRMSLEYGYTADKHPTTVLPPILKLPPEPLYKTYMDSLMPYMDWPPEQAKELLSLKAKEAVLLLLRHQPALKEVLFDFAEPGKIDLEAFMEQNYQFNVGVPRFAYLSGRSVATFKRDFEKIFHTSPGNWLLHKRLQQAHYLIKEKGKKASDVYLDVGFEDLSHFSYAFKNQYGVAPSRI